ncbi:glycerol ABC transporter substrate-binding protein [Halanaeroarchaeum sp. HSR-CO]|uniref:glycerol ABC transporter substrate-binding protein n=1 Tax=Halanaeroarchaeum sp. HSR-CO TaxID=2866382 RepID=UPI00217F00DD|nr:glycerol ABC transporter substrate-binding protein [Halanaeroarchaeum sp. HSR-CO]
MALQSNRLAVGLLALGLVAVVLLYSVVVMRAPLQILSVIVPLVFLYLLWRFVRAHERIAAAMESADRVE